mmetsp:Transcript_130961/g.292932  ORF Transcript_130961/g.292932 Transcript_130961/m.292932 type:complete len:285 (+) Transcript_130961:646-1500(+)
MEPTSGPPPGPGGLASKGGGGRAPPSQSPGGASKGGRKPPPGGASKGGLLSTKPGGPSICGGFGGRLISKPFPSGWSNGGRRGSKPFPGGGGPSNQPPGPGGNGGRFGSKPPFPMGASKGGRPASKGGMGGMGGMPGIPGMPGMPNGGGGPGAPKGGGPGGPKGGRGPRSKGGRMPRSGGRGGGIAGSPCRGGIVTQACLETGKSAVQSTGKATTNCASSPFRFSGQSEAICRLNFSSTTGTLGGPSCSSAFAVHHSMRLRWQSFCMRSVGLPAMSSGSGFPGT